MKSKFKKGDKVTLNNYGLNQIGGLKTIKMIEDNKSLVITSIKNINPNNTEAVYIVKVNKDSINQFILLEDCFSKR